MLAKSAESEWKNVTSSKNSNRVSLSPADVDTTTTSPFMTPSPSHLPPNLDAYLASITPGRLASPWGLPLRVVQSARGDRRLDPFAISLLDNILSKGTGILKRPVFPYSFATEPTRFMEMRTHLLRRYAALPENASHPQLVAATEQLLRLWDAKLVNASEASDLSTLQESPQHKACGNVSRMVSPLKRNGKQKPSPIVSSRADGENNPNDLSPFLVKDGFMGTVPPSEPKGAPFCGPRLEAAAAEVVRDSAGADDTATSSPPIACAVLPPMATQVLGKDVLFGKQCTPKRGPSTLAKNKKKKSKIKKAAMAAVQRLVRRWTLEERGLYLRALEQHGLDSTDAIFHMIPGK